MAKFEELFVNFAFASLLILGIVLFGSILQTDNNANETIMDNTLFNDTFSTLKSDLEGFSSQAQTQRTLFETEKPTTGFGSLILFSIVSSGKVFTGMTIGSFNLLIKLPTILFGLDPVITSILSTVLIVVILLGLWVLYKLGG